MPDFRQGVHAMMATEIRQDKLSLMELYVYVTPEVAAKVDFVA